MNAGLTHKSTIPGGAFHSRKEPDLKELVRPDLQQAFEKFTLVSRKLNTKFSSLRLYRGNSTVCIS
jgi:hypothetical protein